MTETCLGNGGEIDVAIIGGGPSGLAAATQLKQRGISRVVVLERETEAGGIPRHCGHPPFGMREFKRVLTGPKYVKKLVEAAISCGVEIHPSTTVVEAKPGGELLITTPSGIETIVARRIIYATGVRETPRSARLISGDRTKGVLNTGALQSMIYLKNQKPFERPVIIGSELVSYSTILTCRHADIRPVAMIEERANITARWPYELLPRLMGVPFHTGIRMAPRLLGVPLHLGTRLVAIEGEENVRSVSVEGADGVQRGIECDGVILTGQFTPESSLALCGHLDVDPATGGPAVDQFGRCSDPVYFAAGNVLRPVETADWCWNEGCQIGNWVADDLVGEYLPGGGRIRIEIGSKIIKYVLPQKLLVSNSSAGMNGLQLRFQCIAIGILRVRDGQNIVWEKKLKVYPENRILIPLKEFMTESKKQRLKITFEEAS